MGQSMCRPNGLRFLFCRHGLTVSGILWYNNTAVGRRRVVPLGVTYQSSSKGGDNMTTLEVLALLNLLVVVIFGVIDIMVKKK